MSNRRRLPEWAHRPLLTDPGRPLVMNRVALARAVSEAVATAPAPVRQRVTVRESPRIVEAPKAGGKPGRLLVQLIKAGWSLNGRYYPAEVLERDGPRAFPAGTLNFIDHATDTEDVERPAGSLQRLASVQASGAYWDPNRKALLAEVRLFAPWREAISDMAEHIGMSIRAWVMGAEGDAEGRRGFVVSELSEGTSVDYVTVPAAGGGILSVLESANHAQPLAEARNIGAWLESRLHLALTQMGDEMYGDGRLTRDERITLSSAIGDALGAWTTRVEADAPQLFTRDLYDEPATAVNAGEAKVAEATAEEIRCALHTAIRAAHGRPDLYPWVRDFDPDAGLVWFDMSDSTWQRGYTIADDGTATLTGEPVQVTVRTVYEPRAEEAATAPPTTTATPVVENVTGGAPPTAPTPNTTEESMGTNPGQVPEEAGTATVSEATAPPTESAPDARTALLESERDQLRTRATSMSEALAEAQAAQRSAQAQAAEAVAEMRRLRANESGRTTVDRMLAAAEAGVPAEIQPLIAPRVHAAVLNHVPLTDTGDVDQPALEALVTASIRAERVHAAQLLEAQGVGRVHGLGAEGDPAMQMTDKQLEEGLAGVFVSLPGMSSEAANLAAKGR